MRSVFSPKEETECSQYSNNHKIIRNDKCNKYHYATEL